jgi:bacillithiol synthase
MLVDTISPNESGYFSKLMLDYLNNDKAVQPLFNRFPSLENFNFQISEKQNNYTSVDREILFKAITLQYSNKNASQLTLDNIAKLKLENTFTITTGHQLNLFTGPIYYIYKILSVINLVEDLSKVYPTFNFVPVFWMATEDHDFEEINYFKFRDKKIKWSSNQKGPVGRFNTQDTIFLKNTIEKEFGISKNATFLVDLFLKAYTKHNNLADATFFLTNELFKEFGIVVVNGDDKLLKSNIKNILEKELVENVLYHGINEIKNYLSPYHVQVNPREINLFYIEDGLRERIIYENGIYKILNTSLQFSPSDFLELIQNNPEKFSPNAILRPIYQEKILPNLAYIGGGGELAYWLELKSSFEKFNLTFPMLIHRDSVMIITEKDKQKLQKLDVSFTDLFKSKTEINTLLVKKYSENNIDFNELKKQLEKQFLLLNETAVKTDKSFKNAISAQQKKQFKGLENLEQKLLRAEKKVLKDKIERVLFFKEKYFPNDAPQERVQNFSEFFIDNDSELLKKLKININPLKIGFKIIQL